LALANSTSAAVRARGFFLRSATGRLPREYGTDRGNAVVPRTLHCLVELLLEALRVILHPPGLDLGMLTIEELLRIVDVGDDRVVRHQPPLAVDAAEDLASENTTGPGLPQAFHHALGDLVASSVELGPAGRYRLRRWPAA